MSSALLRSLTANWIGIAINSLVGLIVPAMVVRSLGSENYGVWAFAVSIAAQIGILDLGTRHAVVRHVALYKREGNPPAISKLLSSSLALLTFFSWIGVLLLSFIAWQLPVFFTIRPEVLITTQGILFLLALDAAFDLLSGPFSSALGGIERYDLLQGLNSSRLILNGILTALFLYLGWGLWGVALALLLSRLLYRVLLVVSLKRLLPGITISRHLVSAETIRQILRYSGWTALMVLSFRLSYQFDLVIIGSILGPLAVTHFALPLLLIDQMRALSDSAGLVLFSRLSGIPESRWQTEAIPLLDRWARYAPILPLSVGLHVIVFGESFIKLWVGIEIADIDLLLALLALPFFITSPASGFYNALLAKSKPSVAAKLQFVEAGCNILLSLALISEYGLIGVALGTAIPALIIQGIIAPIVSRQATGYSWSRFAGEAYLRPLFLIPAYFFFLISCKRYIGATTYGSFFLANAIPFLVLMTLIYFVFVSNADKKYVQRRLGVKHDM